MSILLSVLLACAPHVERGPIRADQAAAPVELLELPAPSATVSLAAMIRAGSALDPVGQEGLAWLTATALAQAGGGSRSPQDVREALHPTGQAFTTLVDDEWVNLRLTCHKDHASLCIELFADALTQPKFDALELTRIADRGAVAVTDGLRSDMEAAGNRLLESTIYEGHPYAHPPEGRASSLLALSEEQVSAFHRTHYVRESVYVGIAGAFDAAEVADLRERLAQLPTTISPEYRPFSPPKIAGRQLVVASTPGQSTGFHLGHAIDVDRSHPDYPALVVAMTAFGSHRRSWGRLYKRMREERGLNYGDYAYAEAFVQRGWTSSPEQGVIRSDPHFSMWIRPTSLENGPFALRQALAELETLVAEGLTEEEFDATREHMINGLPLLAVEPSRKLAFALESAATDTPNMQSYLPERLAELDREQVNAAIARHIHPENLAIVAVSGDPKSFKAAVSGEGPTPIVYSNSEPSEATALRDAELATHPFGIDQVFDAPEEPFR